MSHGFKSILCYLMLVIGSGVVFAEAHFTGKFSAAQQTHESSSDATGTASLILSDQGLWFYLTVEGLSGDITAAHIHQGSMGTDGGVVRTISTDFKGTAATGLWQASDSEPFTDAI